MNGFQKRSQQIKHKIMQTTLDLLQTFEPKQLRIADIAKQAVVSQVTIYNYFGSKEALLREAFIDYVDRATFEFETYMNEEHSLREKIEHIIMVEKQSFRQLPPRLIREMLLEDPELRLYIDKVYQEKTIPMTTRILQEGKDRGEISENVSIDHVLAFIQLYMNQYDSLLQMAEGSGDAEQFFNGMVHMFFYGICGKP